MLYKNKKCMRNHRSALFDDFELEIYRSALKLDFIMKYLSLGYTFMYKVTFVCVKSTNLARIKQTYSTLLVPRT